MGKGVKAGEAFVEILGRTKKLEKSLRRAQKKLKDFAKTSQDIGFKLVKTSTLLATPFIAGAKVFADFETQMAKVGTLLDGNEAQLESFSGSVKRLSKEFGESTDVLASGLFDIVSASSPANKAIGVLRESVKLAKAGFTDTAIAADAITTVLNAYSLSADKAGDVSDFLFQTAKKGKTDFARLAPNIGKVATTAAIAGISLEEFGASLATITRAGISTEEAVTGLQAIIKGFLTSTDSSRKAAKKFGIELSAAGLSADGLFETIKKLEGADAGAIAELFPNVRAIKGILPLLQNLTGFSKDIEDMGNRAGITDKAFQGITKTLTFLFNKMKQVGVNVFREIGTALEEPLKETAKEIANFLDGISNFIKQNRNLVISAVKVVAGIFAIGSALISVSAILFIFAGAMAFVITIASVLVTALAALLSPIGLMIAAISVAAVFIVKRFGLIEIAVKKLEELFSRLQDTFSASFNAIVSAIKGGDLETAFKIMMAAIDVVVKKGLQIIITAWSDFKTSVVDIVSLTFESVLLKTNEIVSKMKSAFVDMTTSVLKQFRKIEDGFKDVFDEVVGGLAKLITKDARVRRQIDIQTTEKILARGKAQSEDLKTLDRAGEVIKQGIKKEQKQNADIIKLAIKTIADDIKTDAAGDIKKANEKLIESQKDLTEAINGSKDATEEVIENSSVFDELQQAIENFAIDQIDTADPTKLFTTGGFNPFGLNRQTQSFQNEILKHSKDTADNTKKLARNQGTGAVFQ